MNLKLVYRKLLKLMDRNEIIIYHLAMVLFVIHGNRSEMLKYLEDKPEELVPLFNEKAKKLDFEFTDKVPTIIDMDKVQKICFELESIAASEDAGVLYIMNAAKKDLPSMYVMSAISGIKKSDQVLIDNLNYGNLIYDVLKNNVDQRIDGFEKTSFYDFGLILIYCMDAMNTNLTHGEYVASDKEYDKTLSVINYQKNGHWAFAQKKYSIDIFKQIDADMTRVKSGGYGIFGVHSWLLDRDSSIKNDYVRRGLVDTVIQLSDSIGEDINIILIVRKSKVRDDRSIRMINAPDGDLSDNIFSSVVNKQTANRVIKSWNKNKDYAGFVRNVSFKEIEKSNNALFPGKYVQSKSISLKENLSVRVDFSKLEKADTYKLSDVAKICSGDSSESDIVLRMNDKKIVKVEIDSKYVYKQWFKEFLRSPLGKLQLTKFNTRTAGNLQIPIVPLKEQIESIKKFNLVKTKVKNVNASLNEATAEIEQRLYDSMGIGNVFEIKMIKRKIFLIRGRFFNLQKV